VKTGLDRPSNATSPAAGFTLIEIVGAFFMMTVILVFITGIFVENGRQRKAATELIREKLSATGALALIAADLESAVLVAPAEGVDPTNHPWQFLADDSGELGARSIRFVTQNASTTNAGENASTWVEVAYFLEADEDGELTLWRWRSARPPAEVPRGFPDSSEAGSVRVAVGVSEFGVRLLDFEGSWTDDWDSTFRPRDQMLPEAAEITIGILREARRGEVEDDGQSDKIMVAGLPQQRHVTLVMKPLDVAALIELADDRGGGDDTDCFTVGQCLDLGENDWYGTEIEDQCGGDDELCDLLTSPDSTCWSTVETGWPEVAVLAPEGCDS
jgi:hypothetical protein